MQKPHLDFQRNRQLAHRGKPKLHQPGSSRGQNMLEGFHLHRRPTASQQAGALPERTAILLQEAKGLGVEVKRQPVKEPTTILRGTRHESPIKAGKGCDRAELKVLTNCQATGTPE